MLEAPQEARKDDLRERLETVEIELRRLKRDQSASDVSAPAALMERVEGIEQKLHSGKKQP